MDKAFSLNKITKVLTDYVVMILGCFMYAAAWECFMIPNEFSSGGLTGLCTLLNFATGGLIPVSASYMAANVVLLIIAFIILGKSFGIRTIFCIGISAVFFQILPGVEFLKCLPDHFFYVSEPVMIPIIGGLIEGVGLGIIFLKGGSTGGSDIVAMIINKFWPISVGTIFLYMDAVIVSLIILLPDKSFSDMVFGYIFMVVSAPIIDFVLLGSKSTVQVLVFSDKYKEIADYIIHNMDRGVTTLKATGWYTKSDREVLLLIMRKRQLHDVTAVVKQIDSHAFVSVSAATSVYGEGFEEIKSRVSPKSLFKKTREE